MSAEPPPNSFPGAQLVSPCVGTCRLDPATGWCVGCGRDADELTCWRDFDAARRAAVWAALPERLRQLGQDCRLLPWLPEAALAGIAMAAKVPGAALVKGSEAAIAEFMAAPGGTVLSRQYGRVLELHTTGARARLNAHPGLRVFAGPGRLALTLHRSRLVPVPAVITELGLDGEAVRAADRELPLVDLGLGRPGASLAVRLADPALLRLARRHLGQPLQAAGELTAALITAAPTRVLTTPLGRIEIEGPLDRADHDGPHTRFAPEQLVLAEQLAAERLLPSGLALPDAYVAVALVLEPEATARSSAPAAGFFHPAAAPS